MKKLIEKVYLKDSKLATRIANVFGCKIISKKTTVKAAVLKNINYDEIDRKMFEKLRKQASDREKKLFSVLEKQIIQTVSKAEKIDKKLAYEWYGTYLKYMDTLGLLQKLYSEPHLADKKLPDNINKLVKKYESIRDKYIDYELLATKDDLKEEGWFKHDFEHLRK